MRILRVIPSFEKTEFARLGGIHRNSLVDSPWLLDGELRLKSRPNIRFAVQITGCKGYLASAAIGLIAARFAAELRERSVEPPQSAIGALLRHITGGADANISQPKVNFGLMPICARARKADRKKAYTDRARECLSDWLKRDSARRNPFMVLG